MRTGFSGTQNLPRTPTKYPGAGTGNGPGAWMRRGVFATVLMASSLGAQQPVPTKVNPPIVAVQLYAGQAMVRRAAALELKPGTNEIVVEDLPGAVLNDSLRVAVDSETVKLEEVRVETDHQRIYRSDEAKEAEDLLRKAESRLRTLSDRYASFQDEESYLLKIQAGPAPTAPDRRVLDPGRWQATLDFQQEALRRNHEGTEKILEEIDAAREELAVALVVAERYRSETSLSKKRLVVSMTLQGKDPVRRQLSLEYRIGGASWFPIYSARVLTSSTSDRAKVRLAAYALVKNETGEDWRHIRLGFSAADPDESARLPALAEWHIKPVLTDEDDAVRPAPSPGGAEEKRKESPSKRRLANESPAVQRSVQVDEKVMDRETNGPAKPSPVMKKQDLARQQLDTQTNRTRDYFAKNNEVVKDERARQKTEKVQTVLGEFRTNMLARDRAVQRGDFDEALKRSEQVIENIGSLDGRYRRFFKEEEEKSLQVKRQSLEMLDARRFTSRLVNPLQAARGFDYRYDTQQPEDVRSDGAFRKIFLFERELSADLFYETVPGQKPLAFLVGETRHQDSMPLLAGPVSVFHNTDYVGESSLASVSSKDPFLLHLGADEEIKVERTERNFRETEGIISRTYTYRYDITLTVKNRRRKPSTIVLFDRLPVPSDERVKVTDVKIDPEPADRNVYGLLRFRVTLQAGEEKKIRIQYRLSHPADVLPVFRESGSPRM